MSWVYRVMSVGGFSAMLGVVEIAIGLLIALSPVSPLGSAAGSGLAAGMFLTTLSFLITTPGWEPTSGRLSGPVGLAGAIPAQGHRPPGRFSVHGRRGPGISSPASRRGSRPALEAIFWASNRYDAV